MFIEYQLEDERKFVRINYYEELIQKQYNDKVRKLKIYRKMIGNKIQKFNKIKKVELIKIQDVQNIQCHLDKLEKLIIDNCTLNFNYELNTIVNPLMKKIQIVNCNIRTLQIINITYFPKLKILDLSNNKLTHIPNHLHYCKELNICNFSNNEIQTIPMNFNKIQSLKILDISNNHLQRIDMEQLPNSIEVLDLSFNNIYMDTFNIELENCKKIYINGCYFIRNCVFKSNNFEEIYCLDTYFESVRFEQSKYSQLNILCIQLTENCKNDKIKYINIFDNKKIVNLKSCQLSGQSLCKLINNDIYL